MTPQSMQSKIEEMIFQATERRDKLQEKYDNSSMKWQESERGEAVIEKISEWDNVLLGLEQAEESLGNINAE